MRLTFKVLSALLRYPTAEIQAAVPEMRAALDAEARLPAASRAGLERILQELASRDLYDLQERYVLLFDRTRSQSLDLFEHVAGDDHALALVAQPLDQLHQVEALVGVEAVEGLVEEEHLRVVHQGLGHLDPLAHALGVGGQQALVVRFELHRGQGLACRLPGVGHAVEDAGQLSARAILDAVGRVRSSDVLLLEGGPHLLGDFFAESCVDEQFLTLAPQVAGRDGSGERPGLVAGRAFAPEHPLWGTLVSVKRGGNHLFLRYAFAPSG